MIKEELLKNAKKLHLDTHEDVLEDLVKDWVSMHKNILNLKSIDVSDTLPMSYPREDFAFYLREDELDFKSNKDLIIKNAPHADENFILLNKVVKND